MRLIDADAIDYRNDKMHDKSSDFIDGVIYMAQRIEDAPSIDIVRCGECIRRDIDNQGEEYCAYVKGLADINDESFCSWGERESE